MLRQFLIGALFVTPLIASADTPSRDRLTELLGRDFLSHQAPTEGQLKAAEGLGVAPDYQPPDHINSRVREWADTMKKNAQLGAANEEFAADREKLMKLLGINEHEHRLYVFVSESMPEPLIRSYAAEAFWAGASLVYRGLPPDMKLSDFIRDKAARFQDPTGAVAQTQIDPRLFDTYNVTAVPTIVLAEHPYADLCAETTPAPIDELKDWGASLPVCNPVTSGFEKVTGAVSITWALDAFADAGSQAATAHLEKLREHHPVLDKEQMPWEGDFVLLKTPEAKAWYLDALQSYGEVRETDGFWGVTRPNEQGTTK